jgi:hypothetical protein
MEWEARALCGDLVDDDRDGALCGAVFWWVVFAYLPRNSLN